MENELPELPDDAVEMVREIRRRKYEATKHMTREELWAYEQEGVAKMKQLMKEVNPDDYDFSWLRGKSTEPVT